MSRGFTMDWLMGCGEADRLGGQCGEAEGEWGSGWGWREADRTVGGKQLNCHAAATTASAGPTRLWSWESRSDCLGSR